MLPILEFQLFQVILILNMFRIFPEFNAVFLKSMLENNEDAF